MTKELFIETIDILEKQSKIDDECRKAAEVIFPQSYMNYYDNQLIINHLLKIIKTEFNDNHKDSWIDYFIYELDYGKKYKKGCATTKEGKNINLMNSAKLYKFLNEL